MFTGIIEKTGKIEKLARSKEGAVVTVSCTPYDDLLKIGDSIAINGTCLTVVSLQKNQFTFELSPETLSRTTFQSSKPGDFVNLERPLRLNDRLGGHLVSGHIDGKGQLVGKKDEGNSIIMEFSTPPEFARYLIPKGSIAIDGISLTVIEIHGNQFTVSIIPHTLKMTNLGNIQIGGDVNLEFDLVAKYIERFSQFPHKPDNITKDFLQEHGFA